MKTLGTLILATLVFSACVGGDDEPSTRTGGALPDDVVVFTPEDLDGSDGAPDADWMPSDDDVVEADELLATALLTLSVEQPRPYDDYIRQYAGVEGHTLEVNGLCETSFDWEDSWIIVNDGGSCYWQATVRDGRVDSFQLNGSA
jgi:hypothetical protein